MSNIFNLQKVSRVHTVYNVAEETRLYVEKKGSKKSDASKVMHVGVPPWHCFFHVPKCGVLSRDLPAIGIAEAEIVEIVKQLQRLRSRRKYFGTCTFGQCSYRV